MTRGRWIALAATVTAVVAALVVFALYNRGNPIVLDFGLTRWRGEAVYAIYGAVFLGLLLMFLAGLPADLSERQRRRRLERRVADLSGGDERPDAKEAPAASDETGRPADPVGGRAAG